MDRSDRKACDLVREAISARLDREPPPLDEATVGEHLSGCAACSSFASGAADLRRRTTAPGDRVPDLAPAILSAVPLGPLDRPEPVDTEPVWRPAGWAALARAMLVLVAALQLMLAVPALILADESGASVHVARELGSWDLALAVAWLAVALRPARSVGFLPFAAALAALMVGTAIVDFVEAHHPVIDEFHHGLGLVGLTCTWVLSRSVPRDGRLLPSFR